MTASPGVPAGAVDGRVEAVAEALTAHESNVRDHDVPLGCRCGWVNPMRGTPHSHRAHVAAAVLAALDAAPDTRHGEALAVLAEHAPVLGVFDKRAGIVGCSCLSARDYRIAGHKSGQAGWREHVAEALAADADGGQSG